MRRTSPPILSVSIVHEDSRLTTLSLLRMGHLYVLKLRGGKWYVGYTNRSSIERILEHIEKKGAKWTKAHPPLKKGYLHNFTTPGKTREDEDNYTLRLMAKHGIENVRGGSWCMVKMRKKTIRELKRRIGKAKPKASAKKKTAKKKARKKTKTKRNQCEAMTDVGSRCSIKKVKGERVCHVHKRLRVRPWKW